MILSDKTISRMLGEGSLVNGELKLARNVPKNYERHITLVAKVFNKAPNADIFAAGRGCNRNSFHIVYSLKVFSVLYFITSQCILQVCYGMPKKSV